MIKKTKKNIRKTITSLYNSKITKIVLSTIAAVGFLSVAMVVPNLVKVVDMRKMRRGRIETKLKDLVRKGYLSFTVKDGERYLEITEKGRFFLISLGGQKSIKQLPDVWDGKWHILIFDIPEKKRVVRRKIRSTLVAVGFVRLQDSVWVYPYDCKDLISLLKLDFKIGKEMLYLVVDSLEEDSVLRKEFDLE